MKIFSRLTLLLGILMLLTGVSVAQSLTLYVIPAPRGRDWSGPRGLIISTIINKIIPQNLKKHPLGHVIVKLSNGDEKIITGSVQADNSTTTYKIVRQGYGMGLLYAFMEGKLEETGDLYAELLPRLKTGKIAYIRFLISQEIYHRLKLFLTEYKARGYNAIYNGYNKPRAGYGAGCSVFGISFLDVAGFLNPAWEEKWTKYVRVPMRLIGGPITGNKVSMLKVLATKHWAEESEPHIYTKFYEPNFIYDWIIAEWKKEYKLKTGDVKLVKNNKAFGLEYDYRDKICPEDAIFD